MIFGRVMMFSLEMDVEKRICLAQKKKKKKKNHFSCTTGPEFLRVWSRTRELEKGTK